MISWLYLKEGKTNNLVPFAARCMYELIQSLFSQIHFYSLSQTFMCHLVACQPTLIHPRNLRGKAWSLVLYLKYSCHFVFKDLTHQCLVCVYIITIKTDTVRQRDKFILQFQMHPALCCVPQIFCTPEFEKDQSEVRLDSILKDENNKQTGGITE